MDLLLGSKTENGPVNRQMPLDKDVNTDRCGTFKIWCPELPVFLSLAHLLYNSGLLPYATLRGLDARLKDATVYIHGIRWHNPNGLVKCKSRAISSKWVKCQCHNKQSCNQQNLDMENSYGSKVIAVSHWVLLCMTICHCWTAVPLLHPRSAQTLQPQTIKIQSDTQ